MPFVRAALECGGTIDGMLPVSDLGIWIWVIVRCARALGVGKISRRESGACIVVVVSCSGSSDGVGIQVYIRT
jgi:hypothetical protein